MKVCPMLANLVEDTYISCLGPGCQWWHKCRQPSQCPKCGKVCEREDYARGYECTACNGWFDKDGGFISYGKKEVDHEADKTVA